MLLRTPVAFSSKNPDSDIQKKTLNLPTSPVQRCSKKIHKVTNTFRSLLYDDNCSSFVGWLSGG